MVKWLIPKTIRDRATYLPQGRSTSVTDFNLKTNYELLGSKLKFKLYNLKTTSDKMEPKDFLFDKLNKIPSWSNLQAPSQTKVIQTIKFVLKIYN